MTNEGCVHLSPLDFVFAILASSAVGASVPEKNKKQKDKEAAKKAKEQAAVQAAAAAAANSAHAQVAQMRAVTSPPPCHAH